MEKNYQKFKDSLGVEQRIRDIYRLSIENLHRLSSALIAAEKDIQRDQTLSEVVCGSSLFSDVLLMQMSVSNQWLRRERCNDKYNRMKMGDLLERLYQLMQQFHHYAACKGADLPGIVWEMEASGIFAIKLGDCAVNMEHSFRSGPEEEPLQLVTIGLNLPLLEYEDPESEGSGTGQYDRFLLFRCKAPDEDGIRDIYPYDHWVNCSAIANIFGSLDIIKEMKMPEESSKDKETAREATPAGN